MCLLGGSPRLKHGSRLHCEIANMPPKRCRHGKAAAKAKAKAVAKAVAKAKMVAKAQAKAKARARFGRANSRRQHRRRALAELNVLAGECGLFAAQVVVKVVAEIGGADTPRQALGGDAWRVGAALAAGCALGQ